MDDAPPKPVYVIDTSVWFELRGIMAVPGMWDRLDRMMNEGRIVIPEEVVKEVGDGGDAPDAWVRNHKGAHCPTEDAWDEAQRVADEFPDLVTYTKKKYDADAFVVGTAIVQKARRSDGMFPAEVVVVTGERKKLPGKVAIPDACAKKNIRCLSLTKWFEEEGIGVV